MDKQVFFQVVAPLLSVANTAILAISTPEGELNYYSQLIQLKGDNDEPLFKCIQIGLACQKCLAKGIMKQCRHNKGRLPMWKSAGRQRKTEKVMESDPEMRARELCGGIISTNNFIFASYMETFKEQIAKHPRTIESQPGVIHMAIDPSGGGNPSDYAICSYTYHRGSQVIVGLDASPSAKSDVIDDLILDHLGGLRMRFPNSLIVIYIEANFDFISPDRIAMMAEHPRFQPIMMDKHDKTGQDRVGVRTGHSEKQLYAMQLEQYLRVGSIFFSDDVVSSNIDYKALQQKLIRQLEMYRKDIKMPADQTHGKFKVSYSGKSSGNKDDLAMVLQILFYWSHLKMADPTFRSYCQQNNHPLVIY